MIHHFEFGQFTLIFSDLKRVLGDSSHGRRGRGISGDHGEDGGDQTERGVLYRSLSDDAESIGIGWWEI